MTGIRQSDLQQRMVHTVMEQFHIEWILSDDEFFQLVDPLFNDQISMTEARVP